MSQLPVTLKGTPQGLLLQPQSQSWEEVLRTLESSLQSAGGFFRGGHVILQLAEESSIDEAELEALRKLLETHDLRLDAVLGGDETTRRLARGQGLRTRVPEAVTRKPQDIEERSTFVRKTLRSGQRIYFPGNVTLLGDVNPGGEIIAGGNIVVWGRVRGVVHAGAMGDAQAVICALDLEPSQLRIAGLITRPPDNQERRSSQPEMAQIRDGTIVVEPWIVRGG